VPDAPQGLCPECLMKAGFDTRGANEPVGSRSSFVPPPVDQLARLFPQLEIIALLGQGGMGAVYKARQPSLDRLVALKILPPNSASDPGFAERFTREARALARLNHPNIVAVYDFGQAGGLPYFLMEYVGGSTLREVERTYKLTPTNSIAIVMQICEALQFAHDEGVVHRDIKPENILLDRKGRVKIADFGIAKVLDQPPQDIALTGAKDVVGTAPYMAPEQLENPQNVDHRADIFSLGVVFYELLTGELPLGKFQSPSQKVQVDVRLDEVVLHSLEKEPERRYQHASEVRTDVETIAASPDAAAPPVVKAPAPAMAAPPPARPASTGIGVAIAVAVVGAVGLLLLVGVGVFLVLGVRVKSATSPKASLISSNAFWALLNDDQRLVMQGTERKFNNYDDARDFAAWPKAERADLERRLIDKLKAPRTTPGHGRDTDYYQAINTLEAMRSTAALPVLRSMALERDDRMLRTEISNRRRWMAVRALGVMGDETAVPDLIHLLYHNHSHVRWWAQISLVRLTGQNFGSDWRAWGRWWQAQRRQPPFNPEVVQWWPNQPGPDQLAETLVEGDRRFLAYFKSRSPASQAPAEAEDPLGK